MNESVYDSIACSAEYLGLEVSATELAALANEASFARPGIMGGGRGGKRQWNKFGKKKK